MRYDRYRKQILARPKENGDEVPDLDETDAQALADAFLQKLGYGDFVCCGTEIGAYREREEDPYAMGTNLIDRRIGGADSSAGDHRCYGGCTGRCNCEDTGKSI